MNIVYPKITINNVNGGLVFYLDIKNIWEGYRICYSKDFNFDTDTIPKDLEKLKNESIEDKMKCIGILKSIKNLYGYCEDEPWDESGLTFLDLSENVQKMHLKYTLNESIKYYGESFTKYLNACKWISSKLRMGHESPFEHAELSFTVDNCSRSFTHQLVRHRIASYSQASQRYISEDPDNLKFIIPASIANNEDALKIVNDYFEQIPNAIKQLKALGIKNEDIRCIYPNAISTSIKMTLNFRELKHFFELRLSKHAQNEIRNVAWQLYYYVSMAMPFIWTDIKID